jgi:LacI family transcriptional regulator
MPPSATKPVSEGTNQARIAREAGVSQSTVSRVLNDSAGVDPEKKQRVLEAMERLSYRPHTLAQGLARGRSMTIGVVTPHISSPFFSEILGGIEEGLRGGSYHPIYASADLGRKSGAVLEAIELLVSRRVDALVVLQTDAPAEMLLELSERLPLVVVGRVIQGIEGQCVNFDNEGAAHLATKALLELGHTRIAHVSGPLSHMDGLDRQNGYRRALEEAGIAFDPKLVFEGDFLEPSGSLAITALLARGQLFTAVFAGGDLMAYGARLGLHRQGLRVPEDVSLIGFDDLSISKFYIPPLTTIRQPTMDYGVAAAQTALDLLEGRVPNIPTFTPELVRRESVASIGRSRTTLELAR